MGDHEAKEKPKDYDDFITARPDPILFLTEEQEAMVKEHEAIIRAMIGKNLTAKEVHALYFNPSKEAFDKTIKTVYRYLEALQKAGMVKECGHRKPHDSRLTEKLFCRSANIFVLAESETKSKSWKKEKRKTFIQRLSVLVRELFNIELQDSSAFKELMIQYFEQHDELIMELWRKTPNNAALSDIFSKANLYEIKSLSDLVATIGIMLRNPELCEQIKTALNK